MKKSAKMPMARGGMKTMKARRGMKTMLKGGSSTKKGKKKSVKKGKKRG